MPAPDHCSSSTSPHAQPTDACERTIRAQQGSGAALPDRLRADLERAYGADLAAVGLHDGATADAITTAVRADACTAGADIFFRAGALRPQSDSGVELIAHEVAHAVQQACGAPTRDWQAAEIDAIALARAFVRGDLKDRPQCRHARLLADHKALVLQCHSSWEHRMLGDLRTLDFATIAGGGESRKKLLTQLQGFHYQWHANPTAVTAQQITKDFPNLRPLTLRGSGLVVTYGELNTLADYLASPAELDALPQSYLLPILQQVRQESWAWISWVIEDQWLNKQVALGGFEGSISDTFGWDTADTIWETFKLDAHTQAFGPRGTDHYGGLLARNACHFAPHSWYRWEQFYLQARAFALQAYHAVGARKDRLTTLAWIHHGYADHFLHDSFAAGHLINKTLVMQWYLDWVAPTWSAVPDWDLVQFMTVARQPDLAGRPLYSAFNDPAARGEVRDPQTANEQWSRARRMVVSGARADGSTVESSYKRWLAFLGNSVVQLSSNTVHDHFNNSSLWVSSVAHPTAYQVYGDSTMIKGGDGYQVASETAQLSQRSLSEILATGTTAITAPDIANHFPTKVHNPGSLTESQSLETWAYGFKADASQLFDGLKNRFVGTIRNRIAPVNIDSIGGWRWERVPGQATDIAVGGDGLIWSIGVLGSDGNGPVQRWDPASLSWQLIGGAGVRIAADGAGVVWVVNAAGFSYRRATGGSTWEQGELFKGAGDNGLVAIAAGTDGSVWGLARAAARLGRPPLGHQLLRCVPGSEPHEWVEVALAGGATAVSVGPDGLPWVVNTDGIVTNLDRDGGVVTLDILPGGRRVSDIGVGVGPLVSAWAINEVGISAWNGRPRNAAGVGGRSLPDWEDMAELPGAEPGGGIGGALRIATGYNGGPWVVTKDRSIYRLVAAQMPTSEFATPDAGRTRGSAVAVGGSLFQGEMVAINGSTDLRNVIVGNSGARVYSIKLDRSPIPGVFYRLSIDGQGPSGLGSGSMYIYIEDEAGFTDYKQFWSSEHHTLTIDYNGNKAGITKIRWSDQ